jgi:hypothetical protein
MTRTDSMVLSRPQTAGAASLSGEVSELDGGARRRRVARRGLFALPLAAIALAIPAGPALAQTTKATSGYGENAPAPTTKPSPNSGTAPSKEATTPSKEATTPKAAEEPATTTATPTTTASPSTSKLPFTGLDLRWVLAAGALLLAAGLSIRLVQRRGADL